MLKDIVLSVTKNIHEIGHNGSAVDSMMDSVSGLGHRIKYGHDLEGLIRSYHMDGIDGIEDWFDHMFKDMTSPHGVPLPFAEAIYNITGMGMNETIDWLTINAYDVIGLGTQAALLKFFEKNKKIYTASLAIGSLIGFIDDNPLVVAYNTFQCLHFYKKEGKMFPLIDQSLRYLKIGGEVVSKVCVGAAITDIAFAMIDVNVAELIDGIDNMVDGIELAVEGTSTVADIFDGLATLGLGILATKGVKTIASFVNSELQRKFERNIQILCALKSLLRLLKTKGSALQISIMLKYLKDLGWNSATLSWEE